MEPHPGFEPGRKGLENHRSSAELMRYGTSGRARTYNLALIGRSTEYKSAALPLSYTGSFVN